MSFDLSKIIETWNTDELILFFKKQSLQILHIDNSVYSALRKDKYSGYSFLKCDKEDLIQSGIARGHAIEICSFKKKIAKGKFFFVICL